jgi:hypothetical protein
MNETLTNVTGDEELLDAVRQCWMSLFGPRVIAYRASRGFTAEPAMAVVVQVMIASERSGVAFTADPSTGARDHVVVEAAFGQGEVVVSGLVQPDTYVLDKDGLTVLDVRVGHQDFRIVRGDDGHDRTEKLGVELAGARVLDDAALARVAGLAVAVERHYGCPQDTEWAIADGNTWLVQARPITTLGTAAPAAGTVLARGLSAAPGVAGRAGAGAAHPRPGRPAGRRRGAGGPNDQPGLAADAAPGRGDRHRHRRHDLPRRNRRARAGRAVHCRGPFGHHRSGRRDRRHRGRHARAGARRCAGRGAGDRRRTSGGGRRRRADHRHPDLRQPGDAGHRAGGCRPGRRRGGGCCGPS